MNTGGRSSQHSGDPAQRLVVELRVDRSTLAVHYDVDGRYVGNISAEYPFQLDERDARVGPAIGLGIAAFVAQLCLAKDIYLGFSVDERAVTGIVPLLRMLYDIRCWKDNRELLQRPSIHYEHVAGEPNVLKAPAPRRVDLLWSGGKDSTLSAMALLKNSYEVLPVHITANAGVENYELLAIERLSRSIGVECRMLLYSFPQYIELSTAYARAWNSFPLENTVAFGRDMLLAVLMAPFTWHDNAALVSMGHGYDLRVAYLRYHGKTIPRNDVESRLGAIALERYIQRELLSSAHLLPPIAGLTEYRVLHEMLTAHPDKFKLISFCFWGNNCGRCAKCLRYYLVQRVLESDVLSFSVSPLKGENSPDLRDYVRNWRDASVLFRKQVLFCLGRLVERDQPGPGEPLLDQFRADVFPHIRDELDSWENELMQVHSDPQIPPDFVAP